MTLPDTQLGLTPRQTTVLRLVAQGLSYPQIAARLGCSVPNVVTLCKMARDRYAITRGGEYVGRVELGRRVVAADTVASE